MKRAASSALREPPQQPSASPVGPSCAKQAFPMAASPDVHVGYLVKRLQHRMRQVLERTLSARGVDIGFAALFALHTLSARPSRSGAQLARDCFVSPQTMSSLLRHMEADRWVIRGPHPDNARIDLWRLSRQGSDMLARAHEVLGPLDRHLDAALTLREHQQFRRCVQKLTASLDCWEADLGPNRNQDDDA